jgi:hypothetical protein
MAAGRDGEETGVMTVVVEVVGEREEGEVWDLRLRVKGWWAHVLFIF